MNFLWDRKVLLLFNRAGNWGKEVKWLAQHHSFNGKTGNRTWNPQLSGSCFSHYSKFFLSDDYITSKLLRLIEWQCYQKTDYTWNNGNWTPNFPGILENFPQAKNSSYSLWDLLALKIMAPGESESKIEIDHVASLLLISNACTQGSSIQVRWLSGFSEWLD